MKSKSDVLQHIKLYVEMATARFETRFVHSDVTMEENICQRKSRIILGTKE
jgi:hypothetical protein